MPDIFLHFIFKRWLSEKKPSPKPELEAQSAPVPAPKNEK